jgi:chemotaxis protein CheZ
MSATEGAANSILETAEAIGALAEELPKVSQEPAVHERAGKIGDLVIDLFTHCSFQDLAGQRINKVVATLRLIDERIEAMIAALGEGALSDMPVPGQLAADDEKRLLGGPRTDGASQNDIDKLFG